eukprot:9283807-Ditylum_brightwellii.AAC.1
MYIAMMGKVLRGGHATLQVVNAIKAQFKEEFPTVDIIEHIWTVVSNTTGAARNVADHFEDSSQNNCKMHLSQSGIKYAMDMDGEKFVVTPGADNQ